MDNTSRFSFYFFWHNTSLRILDANWGSSTQANSYRFALASMLKLSDTEEHVKNYRPQVLLMSGNPAARSSLLDFGSSITKGDSLLIAAHVVLVSLCLALSTYLKLLLKERLSQFLNFSIVTVYPPLETPG